MKEVAETNNRPAMIRVSAISTATSKLVFKLPGRTALIADGMLGGGYLFAKLSLIILQSYFLKIIGFAVRF